MNATSKDFQSNERNLHLQYCAEMHKREHVDAVAKSVPICEELGTEPPSLTVLPMYSSSHPKDFQSDERNLHLQYCAEMHKHEHLNAVANPSHSAKSWARNIRL